MELPLSKTPLILSPWDKNVVIEQVIVDDMSFGGHTFSHPLKYPQCGIKVSLVPLGEPSNAVRQPCVRWLGGSSLNCEVGLLAKFSVGHDHLTSSCRNPQ